MKGIQRTNAYWDILCEPIIVTNAALIWSASQRIGTIILVESLCIFLPIKNWLYDPPGIIVSQSKLLMITSLE